MHSGGLWRLGRRPALDGLRGLAIVLVLCSHFDNPLTNPMTGAGMAGVTVFFTLSGFLITSLLLEEHSRGGRVSLAAFYRRRAFRLLPALFAVLTVVAFAQAAGKALQVSAGMWVSVLFYASNWWQLAHPGDNALSPTWSLAIEEQFYLVWPAVFLFAMARWGRRGVSIAAAAGVVVSVVAVWAPGGDPGWGSLERASSLLVGCLLAVWMSGREEGRTRPLVALLGLGCIVPLAWAGNVVLIVLGVPVATVVVLWAVAQGDGPRMLQGRVLRWFGERSYGIYLWHYPIMFLLPLSAAAAGDWAVRSALLVPLSLLVAEASWRLIEQPALRFGRRWSVRSGQPHIGPAPTTPEPQNGPPTVGTVAFSVSVWT